MKRGEIPSIGGLTSFVVAAQHGSFTRAADELNLTQGAISRQIRDIETRLGVRLFERVRQRVVLTDAGKQYLAQVKKALDDLAEATLRVASFNSATLNLVALPTFGAQWLVPRLPNFHDNNPKIMVHVTARQVPVDFVAEPFDAAIFYDTSHWPGTISHYLMHEQVVAVCSPKLKAKRTIKTAADVLKFRLLHKMGKPNRWADWIAAAGIAQNEPPHGHAYENFGMVAQAAVAGLGIALVPRYVTEDDVAAGRLEIVASEFADISVPYYLILPETRASSSAVQAFTKWLIAETRAFSTSNDRLSDTKLASRRPDRPDKVDKILLEAGAVARVRTTA